MTEDWPQLRSWTPTRDTLHAYSRVLGAVRGRLSPAHPRWWHLSLQVVPRGLTTGPIRPSAEEPDLQITLDLSQSQAIVECPGEPTAELDLERAPTTKDLHDWISSHIESSTTETESGSQPFGDVEPRTYEPVAARAYLGAALQTQEIFEQVRSSITGELGPVQLWPHHFDLAFEWFGTRQVSYEADGEPREAQAQIGFGFSTGDESHPEAYFYANPWPFDESLTGHPLPSPASWHTEGWQGTLLPYSAVISAPGGLLRELCLAVHRAAAPLLSS